MCENSKGFLALIGRILICAIFLSSALINKIPNFSKVADYMTQNGVPFPKLALSVAIVLLVLGSISVVIGYRARIGATLLLLFLVAATFYFHDFWNDTSEGARVQQIMFMKNLSMAGTMLLVIAMGSGPWSLDDCCTSKGACGPKDS